MLILIIVFKLFRLKTTKVSLFSKYFILGYINVKFKI